MSFLRLTDWPYHSSPFLQDTMAIKKQKRCRKIRPVSAFISESPSLKVSFRLPHLSQALVPFLFSVSLCLLLVLLMLLSPQVGALRTWKASWGAWGSPLAGSQDLGAANPQLVAPGKVYPSCPLMAINYGIKHKAGHDPPGLPLQDLVGPV